MARKPVEAQKLLSSVTHRVQQMLELHICKAEWKTCDKLFAFLDPVSMATEYLGEQSYITVISVERILKNLKRLCKRIISDRDSVLWIIAEKQLNKLSSYTEKVCTKNTSPAGVLFSRFGNDILQYRDPLMQRVVPGQHVVKQTNVLNAREGRSEHSLDCNAENERVLVCMEIEKKRMLESILVENSRDIVGDDEIVGFF